MVARRAAAVTSKQPFASPRARLYHRAMRVRSVPSPVRGLFLVGALACAGATVACSAVVAPDTARLGRRVPDASVSSEDAYVPPGVDADLRAPDARMEAPDAWVPPLVDAGCVGAPSCVGRTLTRCDGSARVTTECPLGCADAARCSEMLPSNIEPAILAEGTRDLAISAMTVFDTGPCAATSAESRIIRQADGTELCVLVVHDLSVARGASLRVTGARPVAIAASGQVRVDGVIDVSARGREPGPGGSFGGRSDRPEGGGRAGGRPGQYAETYPDGGGGGGGMCGAGGAGGSGGGADGGEGGAGASTMLEPLSGGSGGGVGFGGTRPAPGPSPNAGLGGAGGGALQISAAVAIRVTGSILAGGGGGGAGGATSGNWGAGGGGGAGGAILLEAPILEIADGAGLLASGGGGGAGGTGGTALAPGIDGRDLTGRASGGDTSAVGSGADGGASGGGADADALDGDSNDGVGANGGGGGGGVGCVVLRAAGTAALPGGARLSPSATGLLTLPLRTR